MCNNCKCKEPCKKHIVNAKVFDDLCDSIIDYECPECGYTHSLEPDAGVIDCDGCGIKLNCNIESIL